VLVSGALGAVGLAVSYIAKIKGLRVVGIAGGEEKCKKYIGLGFDGCLNYKDPKWADQISVHCPKGVDIYFDNVGGEVGNTVLKYINKFARFIVCGAVSQYQNPEGTDIQGFSNYIQLIFKCASMKGFFVFQYLQQFPAIIEQLNTWMNEGKLPVPPTTVTNGIETAIPQLGGLYKGSNIGKALVQLGALPSPYN